MGTLVDMLGTFLSPQGYDRSKAAMYENRIRADQADMADVDRAKQLSFLARETGADRDATPIDYIGKSLSKILGTWKKPVAPAQAQMQQNAEQGISGPSTGTQQHAVREYQEGGNSNVQTQLVKSYLDAAKNYSAVGLTAEAANATKAAAAIQKQTEDQRAARNKADKAEAERWGGQAAAALRDVVQRRDYGAALRLNETYKDAHGGQGFLSGDPKTIMTELKTLSDSGMSAKDQYSLDMTQSRLQATKDHNAIMEQNSRERTNVMRQRTAVIAAGRVSSDDNKAFNSLVSPAGAEKMNTLAKHTLLGPIAMLLGDDAFIKAKDGAKTLKPELNDIVRLTADGATTRMLAEINSGVAHSQRTPASTAIQDAWSVVQGSMDVKGVVDMAKLRAEQAVDKVAVPPERYNGKSKAVRLDGGTLVEFTD